MSWSFLITIAAAALVLGGLAYSHRTSAAADRYQFLVRGIVIEVDQKGNSVRVSATHTSDSADELAGVPTDFNVNGAKFYKWTNGVKKRVSLTKSAQVGDEVVMRGAAKDNGNYNVQWLVVNDRTFTITGKLKEHETGAKTLKVAINTSTYKQSQFLDKEVIINYGNSTTFKTDGSEVNPDEVPGSSQKVKIVGKIEDNKWNATHVFNNVK